MLVSAPDLTRPECEWLRDLLLAWKRSSEVEGDTARRQDPTRA